jgi:hypothetical protein
MHPDTPKFMTGRSKLSGLLHMDVISFRHESHFVGSRWDRTHTFVETQALLPHNPVVWFG